MNFPRYEACERASGAFAGNAVVKTFLERSGQDGLPLILVNGETALAGRYPTRAELAQWTGLDLQPQPSATPASCCGKCC